MQKFHKMTLKAHEAGGFAQITDRDNPDKVKIALTFHGPFSALEKDAVLSGILSAPARYYTTAIVELERKLGEAGTLDRLNEIYQDFLELNDYPQLSADELLVEPDVDGLNRLWLTHFSGKFEAIANPKSPELSEYLVVGRIHGAATRALKVKATDPHHAKRTFADIVWAEVQPPIAGAREANTAHYGCDVQIDVVAVGDGIQLVNR